jgi:hypothetical protein
MAIQNILWSALTEDNTGTIIPTFYAKGTAVQYDSQVYKATADHTASEQFKFDFFSGLWIRSALAQPIRWTPNTLYTTGDVAIYNTLQFTCKIGHESSIAFKTDILPLQNCSRFYNANSYIQSYFYAHTNFIVGDIVVRADQTYICTTGHAITSMTSVYNYMPGTGEFWQDAWAPLTGYEITDDTPRWVSGKSFSKNEVVEVAGTSYVCIEAYDGTTNYSIDQFEPFYGTDFTQKWEKLQIWILESSRSVFFPAWQEDVPWISDYIQAVEETMLLHVDYPLTQLQNIRNINLETETDILKKTAQLLGFDFSGLGNLINLDSLYHYVASLSQYIDESGTDYYLDFLNFLTAKLTAIPQLVPPQYTTEDITEIKWETIELYTNDYITFWTDVELIIKFERSNKYVYRNSWNGANTYNLHDTVLLNGWLWTSLIPNNLEKPSRTSNNWILTCLLTDVEEIKTKVYTSPYVRPVQQDTHVMLEPVDIIPVSGTTMVKPVSTHPQAFEGLDALYKYEHGLTPESQWTSFEDQATEFDNSNLLYLNDISGHGFYRTSRVYLYNTARADLIGKDLTSDLTTDIDFTYSGEWITHHIKLDDTIDANDMRYYHLYNIGTASVDPSWANIVKLFYQLAPANHVVYVKDYGYDYTINLLRIAEIGVDRCEIEEYDFIPFICGGTTIKYPTPVVVPGWQNSDYGECVSCIQKRTAPKLITKVTTN